MSIAVAVRKNSTVAMAADGQCSFGSQKVLSDNHHSLKIRKVGAAYMATSSWALYDNLIEDFLSGGARVSLANSKSIFTFFMKFWKALRDRYSFVNDQCEEKVDSPFASLDASFLIVNPNGIFHVADDMSVTEFEKYYAIGSGCDYGLGAVHALYDTDLAAEETARRAVDAAKDFNIYCGGETDVVTMQLRKTSKA